MKALSFHYSCSNWSHFQETNLDDDDSFGENEHFRQTAAVEGVNNANCVNVNHAAGRPVEEEEEEGADRSHVRCRLLPEDSDTQSHMLRVAWR